jgi:hypothetical protein
MLHTMAAPLLNLAWMPTIDAGVPTERLQATAAPDTLGRQRRSQWCWAACTQMLLNYHGIRATQEEIVARMYGSLVNHTASGLDAINGLNGWTPAADNGKTAIVSTLPVSLDDATIASEMVNQQPMLVGLSGPLAGAPGHAYVLTAGRYALDAAGQPHMLSVVLRNPWPDSPSREEMSWSEFQQRCMFAARTRVTFVG